MSKVVLDGSGVIVYLALTPEYLAETNAWRDDKCSLHPNRHWRRYPTSNGGVQIRQQCLNCGYVIGGSRKRTLEDESLPFVDPSIGERYDDKRESEFHAIRQRHARMQHEKNNSFFKEYDEYLRSEAWKNKRRLVLKRANGVCEGCGLSEAREVHHLTYAHRMNEFLFELVAVCTECHERLHEDEVESPEEVENGDAGHDDEAYYLLCSDCRWQGDRDRQRWCEYTDMPAEHATTEGGPCGPQRLLHAELK
ncbi:MULTISPECIES: hypothetical protein [unclassified Ensifer]|uniref:hypothetical protein n=1 Tax=unclassified Ensifer TaxID=2633371 RepID=UPI00088E6BE9|nr:MULTISPECIES: hypothetical protein [unclassified Ensifer]MBD9594518.1 hypothetical protein [Ensifer sp. ENS05]SDN23388.1 hypothetical protein SAMN05216328_121112 [Ensifer sp. YR511]